MLTLKFERELVVVSMAGLLAWASQIKSKSAWPFKKRKFLNQFQRWLNKCYFLVRRRRHRHQRWRRRRRCRRRRRYVTFELCLRLFERKKRIRRREKKNWFVLIYDLSWVESRTSIYKSVSFSFPSVFTQSVFQSFVSFLSFWQFFDFPPSFSFHPKGVRKIIVMTH